MTNRWPPLPQEEQRWVPDPATRGNRADRLLGDYRSAAPLRIAERPVHINASTAETVGVALEAARTLRERTQVDLAAMTGALLRSESVASSKIEHLSARQDEVALAVFGVSPFRNPAGARAAALAVAANIAAMTTAIAAGAGTTPTIEDILTMHRLLLAGDPTQAADAGRLRQVQNWIGGSDHSPRGALFVPPRPTLIPDLLDDLVAFMARTDLDAITIAAIAHAQFETIHPFIDGNGRTGRALVHALWRRLGFTGPTVIPVSTVLLADVDAYFAGLDTYRSGDVEAWVTQFAAASARAAFAGQSLAQQVDALHADWTNSVAPRKGSAVAALLDVVLRTPVFAIDSVRSLVPGTARNAYLAIDRLEAAGVIVEVTGQGRNRIWFAPELFALLERFEQSLGRRGKPTTVTT